jgi:UDP-glucuronate 4-epimerase
LKLPLKPAIAAGMKVFVTGCAGFIGSHLCEFLLRQGHAVSGLDNMNQFYDPEIKQANLIDIERLADDLKKEFVFYHADIRHGDQVAQILKEHKPDVIVHLAAMAGVRPSLNNPLFYEDVNQMGTLTILEEARKAGVKRLVFGSSSSVYGNNTKVPFQEDDPVDHPISPYAATKKAGELNCHIYHKIYGMSIACLRLFTVYGPRQRPDLAIRKFTQLIFEGKKLPVYGDGSFSRDFTHIDDIIAGVYKAMGWVGEMSSPRYGIFNLGESQTTTVLQLIDLISQASGKIADIQYLPEQLGDVRVTYADITKAKAILGYDPKTKIADGIIKFVDWYRGQMKSRS